MKLWKPKICCGWFKRNPMVGFELRFMVPIDHYCDGIELLGIRFLLFEFAIWVDKSDA